jgi:transglutaminase-like putative cysteine protease
VNTLNHSVTAAASGIELSISIKEAKKSILLVALMLLSSFASMQIFSFKVSANSDADGDGLTYGLEYLINTQPNDPDSDNDGLPDGWEWMYGLNPLSTIGADGAVGDPDGDGMSNLQEYLYLQPTNWDLSSTTTYLDNGVWWNGTVPVNDWNEEGAMQFNQVACGGTGNDGTGSIILCDEDPVGNICANGFDDDKDGAVDGADPDGDGDADCLSDDDDGDGIADEDVAGWDTDGDGMPDGWEAANGLNATNPSNADGPFGDPDGDGLINLYEYVNPSWTTMCGSSPCFRNGPDGLVTETISPCNPSQGVGPGGCATLTAEVDGITSTNPQDADSDNDGLNDSYEALTLLTDPTSADTDNDGINDGVEVNGAYGNPPQASDPRDNNTDDDAFDDGVEDANGNGQVDAGETDPTRREDAGDEDNDGIQNWEENLTCTLWNVADTDFGGINDGDERNTSHGTDPCDSTIDYVTTFVSYNSGTQRVTVGDGSGFNPSGGVGWYNVSGTWESFGYVAVVNNVIQGVSAGPSGTATEVSNRNGSFCHTSAVADGTKATTRQYCDDDYEDTDGDGLADWQELLGTFGWFSNPSLVDSDGDGVDDFTEVFDNTDPTEPCTNLLDDDFDGLNNYFENTTGCDLIYIGITNGSLDVWVTDSQVYDTDSGGVGDRDEYFDGTNPENNPADDLLPSDFDGDGIPDAVENDTGTDWTNPDTDGGGVPDGVECPQPFWFVDCVGSPSNPLDPSDDIMNNDVIFWANNTSGVVDISLVHRWKLTTSDFYTGSTYAHLDAVHPYADLVPPVNNLTNLADSSFANDTVDWTITYNQPIGTNSYVPISASYSNISFYLDTAVEFTRSNDTHNLKASNGQLTQLYIKEPEYYFDWSTLASTTVAGQNFAYETYLDSKFTNPNAPESAVNNITNAIITSSGANDAYSIAVALEDFLTNGNSTTTFLRNYDGSGTPSLVDTTLNLITFTKEGSCREYNTAFVTMARLAGLPARQVAGYVGGIWTGSGYVVTSDHYTTWSEVRLQQNSANGNTDLGWIAFDPCPPAAEIEVVNQTISTLTWDRDGSQNFTVTGQLRYTDNATPVANHVVSLYLVPNSQLSLVPGSGSGQDRLLQTIATDANGTFNISGNPTFPAAPGVQRIVLVTQQGGYIGNEGLPFDDFINVTDDSVLRHTAPELVNEPVVGAGATTTLEGYLELQSPAVEVIGELPNQTVWLSFISSVNGLTNISGDVDPSGFWSIELTLDALETKTNVTATLGYSGWQDTSVSSITPPQFHLRPTTTTIWLNVSDAPNLTATIEGSRANTSIIVVDEPFWVNGSALSIGAIPTALSGTVLLRMRSNGSTGPWFEVFNQSVNGNFTLQHTLNSSTTPVAAGEVEFSLRFFPATIPATDDANLSAGEPYFLKGKLNFVIQSVEQLRGTPASVVIDILDHRGVSMGQNFSGNYDFFFNASWVNTTVDPESSTISLSWDLDANLLPGDYLLNASFNGSQFFEPSTGFGPIRVLAEIGWNLSIGQDWTDFGNSTYIYGDIYDAVYLNRVIGNDTLILVTMLTTQGPIDIAQSMLNNSTGEFNITITMPTNLPSDAYDFILDFDFITMSPPGGAYYRYVDTAVPPSPPNSISLLGGIITEFKVEPETSSYIVEMNDTVDFTAKITDVADGSNITGASVEFIWDYGNSNQSLGSVNSDPDGNATTSFSPNGIAPGYYNVLIVVQDDLTASLSQGNSRRYGNSTMINVTVQVDSSIIITQMPAVITAGLTFNVQGQVLDAENNSRPLISAVEMNAFWLDTPDELLMVSRRTNFNGTFNFSIPTDTSNNGTTRGPRTLVLSVVEGSSPFYLTASVQQGVQVMGVSIFENIVPLNPVVVNRGDSINISGRLVESSDMFTPLGGYDVFVKFHDTWLPVTQTDAEGYANFTFNVPFNQPLGLTIVQIMFNGSVDLLRTNTNITSITIRSQTNFTFDPILANPVAGTSFNISGRVQSDNGSGIEQRDGSVLPNANVLVAINGVATGFTVSGGAIGTEGYWNATITLSQTFQAGTHNITATYIPTVNFYLASTNNTTFDSRGFSTLVFLRPSLDGIGQPSLNDRTVRGNNVTFHILLRDNTGANLDGQSLTVSLPGTSIIGVFTTATNGTAYGSLQVPANTSVGPNDIHVDYAGISGTTGLLGSNATTRYIVLAATNLTITEYPEIRTAGEQLVVKGTLLDDLGLALQLNGNDASGIVYLLVDGIPVASATTNATTGAYTLSYTLPSSTSPGPHQIRVEFRGGRDWVDPIGFGDINNPEYYLASFDTVDFNVSVPTKIQLLTPTGEADRDTSMTIQGRLLDVSDVELPNLTVEIWLGGVWITNTTTDANGTFTAVYAVPANQPLGQLGLEVRFTGTTFYLPSNATGMWQIFSQIAVDVSIDSPVAVGEQAMITGKVSDNQLVGIEGLTVDLQIENIIIASVVTNSNGEFIYEWTVTDTFNFGSLELLAVVQPQGYYRYGIGNTSFDLLHRSSITLEFTDGTDATRGDVWEISGRLFDYDTIDKAGLAGETVQIDLDGVLVLSTVTDAAGNWAAIVYVDPVLSRGDHTLTVRYGGSSLHLGSDAQSNVKVWSNVIITIDSSSSKIVTRSDGTFSPLVLIGSVQEIGGEGEIFENLQIYIGNGADCVNGREEARCIPPTFVNWANGNFTITASMPSWAEIGSQYVYIDVLRNDSLYLNAATDNHLVFVNVDANIFVDIDAIVENKQEDVRGSIQINAEDTGEGLEGVSVMIYMYDENMSQLRQVNELTNEDGLIEFEFSADPPYGDASFWGEISIDIVINDPVLSPQTLSKFNLQREEGFAPDYTYASEEQAISAWAYLLVLLIAGLIGGGIMMYRKKVRGDIFADAAEIFAYTAELLAAGDATREAIFNCYQELCKVLQDRGFLRRDHETVREFEFAIRQAMGGISEEALTALDNTFEMARYSREEMGEGHKQVAMQSVTQMTTEIYQIQKVPPREFA